jgi:hypothetical protein
MSLHYLAEACSAFEKTAAFSLDLEAAKAKANELITDMSVEEACSFLNVDASVTEDLLEIAFKAKLIELRQEKNFGSSKLLANKQHAYVKAFSVLESIAAKNSEESYEFDGAEGFADQEKIFMDLDARASQFERLAQVAQPKKPLVLDPKKKNIDFWTNLLEHAIQSVTTLVPSTAAAKQLFDKIAAYKTNPSYLGEPKELSEIEACLQALIESENKLQQVGVGAIVALKQRMPNIHPTALTVLKTNLGTISEGKDFSTYKDYAALIPDEILPQEEIEFPDTSGPGY